MKNYAKTGGKKGKPAYRTPSSFQGRQCQRVKNIKAKKKR
jgi:ABC-type oligopeptide transport system ATPase subunit